MKEYIIDLHYTAGEIFYYLEGADKDITLPKLFLRHIMKVIRNPYRYVKDESWRDLANYIIANENYKVLIIDGPKGIRILKYATHPIKEPSMGTSIEMTYTITIERNVSRTYVQWHNRPMKIVPKKPPYEKTSIKEFRKYLKDQHWIIL